MSKRPAHRCANASSKSKPALAPPVTQVELQVVHALRSELEQLDARRAAFAASLAAIEAQLVERLEDGAGVQPGPLRANVVRQHTPAKCSPKWKDIYLDHMHEDHGVPRDVAEEEQRALNPPGPGSVQLKLSIQA